MATRATPQRNWRSEDHDLLVRLDTRMEDMQKAMQELRDSTAVRLTNVENNKIDRTEVNRLQSESLAVHTDHEARISAIEVKTASFQSKVTTWGLAGIAALGIVEFVLNYIK